MQKINLMGIRSSVILNRYNANVLIMEALSEQEEFLIDQTEKLEEEMYFMKQVGKNQVRIPARDIFLYGEININNQDDLDLLRNSDIITQDVNQAANIPSDFDYESGFAFSNDRNVFKTHDTWDKIDWFKFNHCLIGKPSRIIIYRINKMYVPRNRSTRRRSSNR